MRITCPKCNYSRDIPEDKIPARSVLATCPNCKEKFRFREPVPTAGQPAAPEPSSSQAAAPQAPLARPGLEEPAAQARPEAPPAGPANSGPAPGPEPGGRPSDIWQRLESLSGSDKESERPGNGGSYSFDRRTAPGPDEVPPPWERLEEFGFFPGLAQTIRMAMFRPRIFFATMPVSGGMARPLCFYLLVSEVAFVCQFLWQLLGLDMLMNLAGQTPTPEQTMLTGGALLLYLVVYPLLLAGGVFISTAITHGLLLLLRAGGGGFEATFRVMAYSAAPAVLSIIPFLGWLAGALWSLTIFLVALRWIHRTSYWRILVALHIPVAAIIILAAAMALLAGLRT